MEFRDGIQTIGEGEMIVVPKGVEHNPHTLDNQECWVTPFEPIETLHTGGVPFEKANNNQKWM